MQNLLSTIQDRLRKKSSDKVKQSVLKFVPNSEKVYGVKFPELNKLATEFKSGGFDIVENLWKSGAFEERILAAKILGKLCKENPDKTLTLITKFSDKISDWAVCDTLGTSGIKDILDKNQEKIFHLSKRFIKSKNLWQRRFGLVLLVNYTKNRELQNEIKNILKIAENDNEYYVKKAVQWLKSQLNK